MKNFLKDRLRVANTLGLCLLILVAYYYVMTTETFEFPLEIIVGLFKPMAALTISAIPILIIFLFFKDKLFTQWLKRIASWYLPILLVLAFSSPALSGNIMAIERNVVILYGMVLLFLLTLVFIFVTRKKFA